MVDCKNKAAPVERALCVVPESQFWEGREEVGLGENRHAALCV